MVVWRASTMRIRTSSDGRRLGAYARTDRMGFGATRVTRDRLPREPQAPFLDPLVLQAAGPRGPVAASTVPGPAGPTGAAGPSGDMIGPNDYIWAVNSRNEIYRCKAPCATMRGSRSPAAQDRLMSERNMSMERMRRISCTGASSLRHGGLGRIVGSGKEISG
jgi:hypothetical protein